MTDKTNDVGVEEARLIDGKRVNGLILPCLIQNRMKELVIDDKWGRIIYADGYPRTVSDGWLDKLVSMPGSFDMVIHIQPLDLNDVMRQLNHELKKQVSDISTLTQKGHSIPMSLQIQNEDTQSVLRVVQKGEEKMFNVSIYVNPKADSKQELELLTKRINATLNSVMIVPATASMRMLDGLRSILPYGQDKLKKTRNITSSPLSACFPFTSSGLQIEENGVMFGVNTNNKIPIIIDPFSFNNPNGLILATSGAGKSFFVKIFEIRQMMQGVNVINLDPQGEYAKLTETYHGQPIKISKDSKTVINPFDLMGMDYADKIASLHSLMHTIIDDISSPQQALLDDAFRRIYEEAGITEQRSTWGNPAPIFSDLYMAVKDKEKETDTNRLTRMSAMALTNRLRIFTEGSLKFLNQQTTLDFDNRMVTFDISQVPALAKAAMMYTLLEYVIHKMKNDLKRKIFVIDEAWLLLQHPQAAERIFEIVKTSRKYNMSFILITQEVNDLLSSQAGNSVLANTSWKLLLRQDPSVIDTITKTFKLNYSETMLLMSAQAGEGILMACDNHVPLKVVASKQEYDIVTTKPDDLIVEPEKPQELFEPPKKKLNLTKKVHLKGDLTRWQIDILLKEGFKEVREPGLGAGRGYMYLIKNETGELDQHFIMWNLIYEEIRKRTDKVNYYLTREPDIVFEAKGGRMVGFEVESTIKTESRLMEKLRVLKNYSEWYFIVTQKTDKAYYQKYGPTLTRMDVLSKIEELLPTPNNPETKSEDESTPKQGSDK